MTTETLAGEATADWWRQAIVYQVYPRSYVDSDGDGLGDLRGIIARVPYLSSLGVDAIWLSPFYPSALADGGYDVDHYRDVDPRLGTLDDFDELVGALHGAGIRIFVDIVPNHSSNRHEWFQAALAAAPGSPERSRYHFRDGRGENGELPPNDWPSHFGPSAWTRTTNPDGSPGQWYLHLFAPEQPDFNWDNQEVHDDFLHTIRFWSDRGVDGFRVDVAHALKKDMSEPYSPVPSIGVMSDYPTDGSHPLFDRDDVYEVYRAWRAVFNEYDPPRVAVAEATVPVERRVNYATPETLGQAFNFDLLGTPWRASAFRATIAHSLELAQSTGSSSTWTLSNHDIIRHASRYGLPEGTDLERWLLSNGTEPRGDAALGLRRARAATMMLLALPGSVYLYQGEELGLPEVADLPTDAIQDPIWIRDGGARKGRDGCRVPLPWRHDAPSFGFTSGTPHLPMPAWFADFAADRQEGVEGSTLELYRTALHARRQLQTTERLTWLDLGDAVVGFARDNGWMCVMNLSSDAVDLPEGEVLLASEPLVDGRLSGNSTAWLRARP